MIKNKNILFIILLSIAALSLAGTAAYFSVFGLTKLFYAAGLGITILAASLEFAKLVTVSYVYRFWKTIKKGLRAFYIFAIVFIMFLTSVGIYGFLTSAYQQTSNKLETRDSQIKIAENKKALFVLQLDRYNENIKSSGDRINTISGLRTQQENRLDDLYDKKYVGVAKRTENQITGSDKQIELMNKNIIDNMAQASIINDSIAVYDQKIIELKSSDISGEIGPYQFVSNLTGIPMNNLVNIVALFIILVFDPLAIALLIGVNQLIMLSSQKNKEDYVENEELDDINKEKIKNDIIKALIDNPGILELLKSSGNKKEETIIEEPIIEEPIIEEPIIEEHLVDVPNIEEFKLDMLTTEPNVVKNENDDIEIVASINTTKFTTNEYSTLRTPNGNFTR